jgi:hypothetical protein
MTENTKPASISPTTQVALKHIAATQCTQYGHNREHNGKKLPKIFLASLSKPAA